MTRGDGTQHTNWRTDLNKRKENSSMVLRGNKYSRATVRGELASLMSTTWEVISLSAPVVSIKEKPRFSVECEGVKGFAGRSDSVWNNGCKGWKTSWSEKLITDTSVISTNVLPQISSTAFFFQNLPFASKTTTPLPLSWLQSLWVGYRSRWNPRSTP